MNISSIVINPKYHLITVINWWTASDFDDWVIPITRIVNTIIISIMESCQLRTCTWKGKPILLNKILISKGWPILDIFRDIFTCIWLSTRHKRSLIASYMLSNIIATYYEKTIPQFAYFSTCSTVFI